MRLFVMSSIKGIPAWSVTGFLQPQLKKESVGLIFMKLEAQIEENVVNISVYNNLT